MDEQKELDEEAIEICRWKHGLLNDKQPIGFRKNGDECAPEDCRACGEWKGWL